MLQYKIPQNVQVEDRILSFLTIRQLIICCIGGGIAYIFYITLAPNYYAEVWLPPVAIISAITLAVAFLKINDIPFTKWTLLLVEFMMIDKKRIWDKRANSDLIFAFVTAKKSGQADQEKKDQVKKERDDYNKSNKSLSSLEEITNKLNQNPFEHVTVKRDHTDDVSDHALTQAAIHSPSESSRHAERLEQNIAAYNQNNGNTGIDSLINK